MSRRLALALAAALSLSTGLAGASPLLGDRALAPVALRTLSTQVRAERTTHPERFAAVSGLQGVQPRVYLATRARTPSVVRELRALGRDGLLPMLDLLALSTPPRALTPDERETLQLGLLQVVGELRDRRAEPVLRAAFERTASVDVWRAAARGLGALAGDAEVAYLTVAAGAAGPRQVAALEGLGMSRRPDAVTTLTAAIDRATSDDVVVAAARGLAEAGSSWAAVAAGRATDLPSRSASALVHAYLRASGAARDEVAVSLLAVGAPDTPALLRGAMSGADADARRRLEALERAAVRQLGR